MTETRLSDVASLFRDEPGRLEELAGRLDTRFPDLREQEVNQWVQHLVDLGYLRESQAAEASILTPEGRFSPLLTDAIGRLHEENPYLTSQSMPSSPALEPRGYKSNLRSPCLQPSMIELDQLARSTSFDGGQSSAADGLPPAGETNLRSRSLHFHLGVLGVFDLPAGTPRGPGSDDAVDLLAHLLSKTPEEKPAPHQVMAMMNDARSLSERFTAAHGGAPLVVRNAADSQEGRDYASLAVVNGRFVDREDLDKLPGLSPDRRETILKELDERSGAEARSYNPVNQFGLRLLQLRLWMHGFYRGRLDSWWGPLSTAALQAALEFEGLDHDAAFAPVQGSYVAINTEYVFGRLFDRLEAAGLTPDKCEEAIVQESEYLVTRGVTAEEVRREEKEKRQVTTRIWDGVREVVNNLVGQGKRIYYGAKTLILSAARAVMKGVRWVTGELTDLAGPVLSLTRSIFQRVRQGIAVFTESLPRLFHFLLRRPLVTWDDCGHFVLSRFDPDADVELYVSEGAGPGLVSEHTRLTKSLVRGTTVLLLVAAGVAKTLVRLLAGPVGWLRLGFEIGKTVLTVLRANSFGESSA